MLLLMLFAFAIAAVLFALATGAVADEVSYVTEAMFDYIEFRLASRAARKESLPHSVKHEQVVARGVEVREQFGW